MLDQSEAALEKAMKEFAYEQKCHEYD